MMKCVNILVALFLTYGLAEAGKLEYYVDRYGSVLTIEPRDRFEATVSTDIRRGQTIVKYEYYVKNLETSEQEIDGLKLWTPMEDYLIVRGGADSKISDFLIAKKIERAYYKPQGISAVKWILKCVMGACENVRPGEEVYLWVEAQALPGVVDFYMYGEGDAPTCVTPAIVTPEFAACESDDYIRGYDDQTPYGPGKVYKVPGPKYEFSANPVSALETLITLKEEALGLGWIKNEGIAKSFGQKLREAKKKYERKNKKAGQNILSAFLNEVKASRLKQIDDNAYEMLRVWAEFIIERF